MQIHNSYKPIVGAFMSIIASHGEGNKLKRERSTCMKS
jgi:hypothetical protein